MQQFIRERARLSDPRRTPRHNTALRLRGLRLLLDVRWNLRSRSWITRRSCSRKQLASALLSRKR
nr:MAG TPA: hypothetical protein [Caudoviricetes sp.]